MSLPDLAALLWRQRALIERLIYRLECEQIMLAAGRTRWLSLAIDEVEATVTEMQVLELQRASVSQACAQELGLDPAITLSDLAAAVDEPWSGVLTEHRDTLRGLMRELTRLAESNRHLMGAGLKAVQAAMVAMGLRADLGTETERYDASGRLDRPSGLISGFVDQRA